MMNAANNMIGYNNYMQPIYQPSNRYMPQSYGSYQMQPQNMQQYQYSSGVIMGKFINNESEITPNEVPMDGSMSVFPKNDGSSIIVKTWSPNGTINTVEYIPVVEDQNINNNIDQNPYAEIIERLDRIEKKVNSKKNSITNSHYSQKEGIQLDD